MYSIETKKLTKKFKDKIAVNGIDLSIKQGELFALLGTNGAGKTTTIKMLSGLILPTSGSIKILDMDMKKDIFKIKEILNVSPQETAIAPNLTVKENLEFMAGVYQIKDKDKKINELIKKFITQIGENHITNYIPISDIDNKEPHLHIIMDIPFNKAKNFVRHISSKMRKKYPSLTTCFKFIKTKYSLWVPFG